MADGGGGKLALGAMLKASAAQQMLQVNTIYRFLVVRWLVVLETRSVLQLQPCRVARPLVLGRHEN